MACASDHRPDTPDQADPASDFDNDGTPDVYDQDIDGDGDVDALDIVRVVDAFKGIFGDVTFEQVNIWGCTPDGVIDALDITLDVDAFKGFAFPCGITCP